MLFNSYPFLFVFMPAVLIVLMALRRFGLSSYLAGFLSLASFAFYAYWDVRYLPILIGSIAFNYLVGWGLTTQDDRRFAKALLVLGLVGNLAVLGYFKYVGFFAENLNLVLGTQFPALRLALPLGVSFFTFTQIEYLVDAYHGKAERYAISEYVLFVSFFPHLIAGPILRHHEVIPQFKSGLGNWSDEAFAAGCLFFAVGLFKKTVIADPIAPWANDAFAAVETLTFMQAWVGALAYTLQLYFDFSGYSDMAVGLALMLNVRIPFNFDSPYKSLSIIEFWRRWHITLSNFLRDYLYIPLGGSRRGGVRRTVNLLVTFLLGGLWHGAGWTFIVWGLWHGVLLSLNHAWRRAGVSLSRYLTWPLTFLVVVLGWVVFRSPSLPAAEQYLTAMFDVNGLMIPEGAYPMQFAVLALLIAFVLLLPNTQQLAEKLRPEPGWAIFVAACFLGGFLLIGRVSTFLYYQF